MIKLKDIENTTWGNIVKNNIKKYGTSVAKRKALVEQLSEGNDIKRKFAYLVMQSLKAHAKGFNHVCCHLESLEQYTHNIFDTVGMQMFVLLNDFEWAAYIIGKDIRMELEAVDINYSYTQVLDALSSDDYWKRVLEAIGFEANDELTYIAKEAFVKAFNYCIA